MIELLAAFGTGAVTLWGYLKSRNFVRNRLRFVDAAHTPVAPASITDRATCASSFRPVDTHGRLDAELAELDQLSLVIAIRAWRAARCARPNGAGDGAVWLLGENGDVPQRADAVVDPDDYLRVR